MEKRLKEVQTVELKDIRTIIPEDAELPWVEILEDRLILHNVGSKPDTDTLHSCQINTICHRAKHYYQDGDSGGKSVAISKMHLGQELENPNLRAYFGYTFHGHPGGSIEIRCHINHAARPYMLVRMPRKDITSARLKNIKEFLEIVRDLSTREYIVVKVPLTEEEVAGLRRTFLCHCASEISTILRTRYMIACITESDPVYFS